MDKGTQILAIYAASCVATGIVSYWRGRRGSELMQDTVVHGVILGTGANAVVYLMEQGAIPNPLPKHLGQMGTLSGEAVKYLERIDTDSLYSDFHEGGITVAPIPTNPSYVVQEP